MTSLVKRFKSRQNRAMELTVVFPPDLKIDGAPRAEPEFELTVKRLPEALITNARTQATKLHPNGTGPWVLELGYALSEQMKSHICGWKSLVPGEEFEAFSPALAAQFVDDMPQENRQLLGLAYQLAHAEDEKKSMGLTNTGQDSSKLSENGSSTS